ncbi:hypothetical protein [Streptomyces sp. NPDC051677]
MENPDAAWYHPHPWPPGAEWHSRWRGR